MKNKLYSLIKGEFGRYIVIGTTTTLIDLALFYLLCEVLGVDSTVSNVISLGTSVLYAYVTNKLVVFRTKNSGKALAEEFLKFIGSRAGTMLLELGGVFVLNEILGLDGFLSKLGVQVVIFVANYVLSKLFVFTGNKKDSVKDAAEDKERSGSIGS